jgi:peptide/nickel transport system substrate-binding protein
MIIPMFATNAFATQPVVDTNTFWEGTIGWGPGRADPQRVYDTGSGQLVFNTYETLIKWDGESYYTFKPLLATYVPDRQNETKSIFNTTVVNSLAYGALWSDGSVSKGFIDLFAASEGLSTGDVIILEKAGVFRAWFVQSMSGNITLGLIRFWYTFHLRTDVTPISFYDENGTVVDALTIEDAVFTFKRGLCQDNGPQWMFTTAFFGASYSGGWASNDTTRKNAMDYAHLIDSAIESSGNDLTLNLGMPFPDNAFKQTMCNTWGSIGSKEFFLSLVAAKGYGFDGNLYADSDGDGYPNWWSASICRRKSRSPLDELGAMRWVGTGPYYVGVFTPTTTVDLLRNNNYWGGWSGRNGSIATYEIQYIVDWTTRKAAFLSGDIDTCAVPRANMFELLQSSSTLSEPVLRQPGNKPMIKTVRNIVPSISMDALHPTFEVSNLTTGYMGSGHFPDGIPTTFFNNSHVRKAFAYSFNSTQYAQDSYYGEADYRKNPLAAGLFPDYYDDTVPGYTENKRAAMNELGNATFTPDLLNGTVWDSGFQLTLTYNTGNDMRRIACEMISNFFGNLSTYNGRVGNPFTVIVTNIDWSVYLDQWENFELPIWSIGWLADFADADNFMRPYMHSQGDFAYFQLYSVDNGYALTKDSLLDQALMETNETTRKALYRDLAMIYYNDCPSMPIVCPRGRRWTNYWVKGWYYDALYQAYYIRDYIKMDNCWLDVTGPTKYVSDGVCNIRDVNYLILAFNAKAPQPGQTTDSRWNGNYGANGGVDPSGDRLSNIRDVQGAILHFNHKLYNATIGNHDP